MGGPMARRLRAVIACALFLLTSGAALAEKHALLIGIGDYPQPTPRLDGPTHDVEALRQRLIDSWGFPVNHVATLLDDEASKANILAALDRLVRVSRPGDYVFVYYSGHGTSAFDEDLRFEGVELGRWTGALVPHDYMLAPTPGPDPKAWKERLIVGRRDLRPRLLALDRDRRVFVIFDTCFSGNAVRSFSQRRVRWVGPVAAARSTRAISLGADPFDSDPIFGTATARDEPYPYRRLVYLAAARKFERAEDLSPMETIDARPHGALTNALLEGLDGSANLDGDDALTYDELYRFVHDEVSEKHLHMPQLLYPESTPELVRRPVFEHRQPQALANLRANAPGDLRVRLAPGLDGLRRRIAKIPRVKIHDAGGFDVRIERQADGLLALAHPSGDLIAGGFEDRPPDALLERLRSQVRIQDLIDFAYDRQDFDLGLELTGGNGFLFRDQRFDIAVRADRPAVLLLLNVDKTGAVSVLYPVSARELTPTDRLHESFDVVPPYGTEYLKLFAFHRVPEELRRWLERGTGTAATEIEDLLGLLRQPGLESAQTRLKLVSVGELVSDPSGP